MAPPLIVRAILDTAQYFKAAEGVNSANAGMGASALTMGGEFTKSSAQVVAAGVKVAESLQAQVAEYGRLAAAAKANSFEQKVAAVQGAKAQASLNRMLGVTAVSSARLSAEAKKGERDLGKLSRGALAGSGLFSKLGRSLAFASAGFIAVAGGATVIAESIRQAEGLAAAQRQVDRQLKTSGKSWDQYGGTIDKTLLKEGHLAGFTRTQLLQAFGFLLRVGGNVSNSLKLTGLAADVARGRSISLQAASIALSKALGGSVTALRRLGIVVPNNVTKMKALEYVQAKFAGQAAAGTTASDRLGASLADAGATIGTVVLPTFDRIASSFSNWLTKMQESGRLTKDFSEVTTFLGRGFHLLGDAIATVDKITGSFGKTLLTIGEIWGAIKIVGWISSLKKLATTWELVGVAATEAGAAEAVASAGGVGGIRGIGARLGGLGIAGRVGLGAGFAIGGQVLGGIVNRAIPGQAGDTTGRALQFAGIGAGIGSLIGPEGALAGAGVGALAGAVSSLIHSGPSFTQQMANMAGGVTDLGQAAKSTKLEILGLQSQIAGGQVSRTAAERTLHQAQAEEKATRGTSAHAAAVAKLAAAQYNLAQINAQLSANQRDLITKQAKLARQEKQRKDEIDKLIKSVGTLQEMARTTPATTPGLIQAGFSAPHDLGEAKLDTFILGLQRLQSQLVKQHDPMAKFIKNLIDITRLYGGLPDTKTLKLLLQESIQGTFVAPRSGPGGARDFVAPNFRPGAGFGPGSGPQGDVKKTTVVWKHFFETMKIQLAEARAALTKGTADDVSVAHQIINRIQRLIAQGHLKGQSLLEALQAEAGAFATLQQAQADALAKAQKRIQDSIDPIRLEVALSRAELSGNTAAIIKALKNLRAAAQKALDSGKLSYEEQQQALQQIISINQQIKDAAQNAAITFSAPLKLQLALARDQALGLSQTKDLEKLRKLILKFIRTHKKNIAALIDAYQQLAAVNDQLRSGTSSFLGLFKQASTKKLTAGLGLTPEQRRELRARLSQLGPGQTTPGTGEGAFGVAIDPATGRAIRHPHRGSRVGGPGVVGGGRPPVMEARIDLNVYIDGKHVEATVTRRQQRFSQRNPRQRRGPHAGR